VCDEGVLAHRRLSERAREVEGKVPLPSGCSIGHEQWQGGGAVADRSGGYSSSVGARSGAGGEERRTGEGLVRCGILRGSSGGFYRGRGGRERPGEVEKRSVR
jgi:hypothetical protein